MMDRPISRSRRLHQHPLRRGFLLTLGTLLLLAMLANGTMLVLYHNKALPRTHLGRLAASGMTYAALAAVSPEATLPASFTLQKDGAHASLTPTALGLSVDVPASVHDISTWRHWLPILDLFWPQDIPLHTHLDMARYSAASKTLAQTFSITALPQRVTFTGSSFTLAQPSSGYTLDTTALPNAIIRAADAGATTVLVPTNIVAAPTGTSNLSNTVQALQKQLATRISFVYKSQRIEPSIQNIGSWYIANGQSMTPASDRIAAYLKDTAAKQAGITIANTSDLATATAYALTKNLPLNLSLVPQTPSTVVRTYCTAVRDVSGSVLDDLIGKLAVTYNDTRGWNNSGQIAFEHVDNGCQYTV
ncbi:MAG: hypothetical protein ACREBW_05650, partial [Candidatus Micrarchaeaceae archaeon]